MLNFRATVEDDAKQIADWIESDPDHTGRMTSDFWISKDCVLTACVQDSDGPVLYVRVDPLIYQVRLHIQFAPECIVSKLRVAKAILKGFPALAKVMKDMGKTGIVFESSKESLIRFMSRLGFGYLNNDDYLLDFSEEN